jgi:hypothetical protein
MKKAIYTLRKGYDKKRCIIHARCCFTPWGVIATAQILDVKGSDLFSDVLMSKAESAEGEWDEFAVQRGFQINDGNKKIVGCDYTPIYHKNADCVLLIGSTATYLPGRMLPEADGNHLSYSILRKSSNAFEKMKFVKMPEEFKCCSCGCGQCEALENGNLLIPIMYKKHGDTLYSSAVAECSFDGKEIKYLRMGNSLSISVGRGLYEPSIIKFKDMYYLTLRNDEYGYVAKSSDGLNFVDLQKWCWDNGDILPNYNTQQHWMIIGEKLYLVYTRRAVNNGHVFRHRAPLFAAEVVDMRLKRDTEFIVIEERGARLGNFCAAKISEDKAAVMAAEWMQPEGCEKYGSDNSVFLAVMTQEI